MYSRRSHMETISTVLKMDSDNEIVALEEFGIVPEEYNRYRTYLLSNNLAHTVIENNHPTLKPTKSGIALLNIANKIEAVSFSPELITTTTTNVKREESMPTPHNKTENINLVRERLMRLYIIEDAEVARLAVRLDQDISDEEEVEIAEHTQRRDILHKMLNAVQHMAQQTK